TLRSGTATNPGTGEQREPSHRRRESIPLANPNTEDENRSAGVSLCIHGDCVQAFRGYCFRDASNLRLAQRAASATTESASSESLVNRETKLESPLFPMAITALRRTPVSLARFTGDPRNVSRKASASISANHSKAGFTNPSRG